MKTNIKTFAAAAIATVLTTATAALGRAVAQKYIHWAENDGSK
jgi:hypothetical protein